jgi:2-hydroxycyclohexanecarboxyl-CoA dehydrogenase
MAGCRGLQKGRDMMGRLDGRVAIVTGSGQGVGRGIALALAREGARVVVVGRTLSKCERTAAEIKSAGGAAMPLACDVTHRDEVNAVVAEAVKAFGTVDILVNNAAQSRVGISLEATSDDDVSLAFGSGVLGTLYFMQACFPHLKKHGGKVVNLGSTAGVVGQAGQTAYAIAKEGIRALSRVAAREWGRHGITVNVMCPFADSPGNQQWAEAYPQKVENTLATMAIKRIGTCEEDIGRAALFLASSDSDYVTGQTIMVDGGAHITA